LRIGNADIIELINAHACPVIPSRADDEGPHMCRVVSHGGLSDQRTLGEVPRLRSGWRRIVRGLWKQSRASSSWL